MVWGCRATLLALVSTAACGGTAETDPAASGGAPPSSLPDDAATGGRDAGSNIPWTPIPEAGDDVRSEYVEPVCPDAGAEPVLSTCDPFDPLTGCPLGSACYPYVEYPDETDPCARERYGARCVPEGIGVQGTPCSNSRCSAGFVCVVTGQGTQCVQLCHVMGDEDCPAGLLCFPMDVQAGVGGCL